MCICENKIYTRNELDQWLAKSSYDYAMPRNIIYKDIVNNYFYTRVCNHNYNEDTRTLINYCPVCGAKLV